MKLSAETIEFSNFLTFGKIPQTLTFTPGINIVTGLDHKTERSNGSGKSSLLETIPFALFGRVNKSIKKENIINWKNKKNCYVSFKFKKGVDEYEIRRGIRPDFLEITENGRTIPPPSDVRIFQRTLENEILSFDYYTFQSLSAINLNSYVPILRMDSVKKRQFLERVFGLETFSILNDKANKRLKKTEDTIYKNKLNQGAIIKIQNDLIAQNKTLESQLEKMGQSNTQLNEAVTLYNEILLEHPKPQKELDDLTVEHSKNATDIFGLNEDYNKLKKEEMTRFFNLIDSKEEAIEHTIKECNGMLTKANNRVIIDKERLKVLKDKYELIEGKSECPTCGGNVKGGYGAQVKIEIEDLNAQLKDDIEIAQNHAEQLKEKKKELADLVKKRKHLSINGVETERMKNLNKEIIQRKTNQSVLEETIKEMKVIVSKSIKLIETIEWLTEQVRKEQETRDGIQTVIDGNTVKINELNVQHSEIGQSVKRLSVINDYMEYIKLVCKDENIKQYAISSIIPYLTKQTNHYLSDVGSYFYAKFDNWLDETIEGPGIYNCTYGNLSGAESKSIDLAVQFAFLDIARIQAGLFPDVLILDELLDSSVDGTGLNNILSIIKRRQKDDNSKVYLITHRKEIGDVEGDNIYFVEKRDGYSYLKTVTGG